MEYLRDMAARGGAACTIPAAGAGGPGGSTAEAWPLLLLLGGFVGAGVWMFRRWGPKKEAEPIEAPGEARPPMPGLRPEPAPGT